MSDQRHCLVCGDALIRRSTEGQARFRTRKYCGKSCSDVARKGPAPPPKKCQHCGATMICAPGERVGLFRDRLYCSDSCRGEVNSSRCKVLTTEKVCVVCGCRFNRRDNESLQRFELRVACSKPCGNVLVSRRRSKEWPVSKNCEYCGEDFTQRQDEPNVTYGRRRTCSTKCAAAMAVQTRTYRYGRHDPYPIEWTPRFKKSIRERDGYACQECGVLEAGRAHDVHHIDYDKHNLDESNLITLCRTCHGRTTGLNGRDDHIAHYQAMMRERPGSLKRAA